LPAIRWPRARILAAPELGLTASAAVALSMLLHAIQASGAALGIVVALVWRRPHLGEEARSTGGGG
jgi:hypothetical protein